MPLLAETGWNNDQNLAFALRPLLGKQNPCLNRLSETDFVGEDRAFGQWGAKSKQRSLDLMGVQVTHKPDRGWTPKAYKEREIPIPEKLVASLQAAKATHAKTCPLVFPTAGCRPKLNFLDGLKSVAERAGLSPENFWLHKFRATFATWHLWNGVDLRTVQQWLGHSDMESTMRYLKPSRSQATKDKVNATFAAGGAQ